MFKPTELYKPLQYTVNAEQEVDITTPRNIVTDTLYLEGVTGIGFRYDSGIDGEDVTIEWCEIIVTFEAGNQMFIKTTDSRVLDAFGFDWQVAYEDAPESEKNTWDNYAEHNTYWEKP